MAVKVYDTISPASNSFPALMAEHVNLVREDGTTDSIQNLFNNKELGAGGSTAITISQEEFDALDEQTKLENDYQCYDSGRLYYKGIRYGHDKPETIEGFSKFKEMKEAGLIDYEEEYIVSADENGILLEASDIGYSNAVSNLPCTTVQGAIDKVAEKVDSKAEINDTSSSTTSTYSSAKINEKIDGTTIQTTTTTTDYEYYAITYGDSISTASNQGILIQYKRLNFPPSTYIFSTTSYTTNARETVSVAKISNNYAGTTYDLKFYIDKDNKTMYLKMPSYSGVSLQNLAFKSEAVTYTKVDAIPDTATALTVAEYVTKSEMPTTRSLTLKSGYNGYITEVYDPTTKVVVYNVNINGTFKGLLNSVADGFRVPKGSTSSSDVMHEVIGMYGSSKAMTGDAQFTRLLVRNYGNPHLEVDVNAENTVVSGTITYVTA